MRVKYSNERIVEQIEKDGFDYTFMNFFDTDDISDSLLRLMITDYKNLVTKINQYLKIQ